jgi:tetratricopeptide (TPR) repeat protein
MTNSKKRSAGIILIALSLLLLYGFITLHKKKADFFYNPVTYYNSAKAISEDLPDMLKIYTPHLDNVLKNYTAGYLLPGFLLLLPGILLMAAGLKMTGILQKNPLEIFKDPHKEKTFLWIIAFLMIVVGLLIYYGVLGQTNMFIDEFSYLFQAKVMTEGKLYTQSPPMPRFFSCAHIINDGKWYSKFTPGLPALLIPGIILDIPFIIPILTAAGSLVLLYLVTKEIFGRQAAFVSVFLALFSPYFIMSAVTIFPHTPQGFFVLLFLFLLLKTDKSDKLYIPFAAGISAGVAILIRPADAAAAIAGFIPFIIYLAIKSENKKQFAKKAALAVLGLCIGTGMLLYSNWIQNGSLFLMGFEKYWSIEKWGFGSFGHTPLKGLWNLFFSSARMAFWVVPLTSAGLLFALFLKRKEVPLLLIPPVFILLFYIGYYSLGNQEFGARYYYLAYILLLPLCAAGISGFPSLLKKHDFFSGQEFSISFMLLTAIAVIAGAFPGILPLVGRQCAGYGKTMAWLKNPPVIQNKSLTFIRNCPALMVYYYTRNKPDYSNDNNLLAMWLMPDENLELIKAFPDRTPWLITYDDGVGYQINPYPMDKKLPVDPSGWFYAGLNYKLSVLDDNGAEKAYKKTVELAPQDVSFRLNLALFYMETKKYKEALDELTKLEKDNPDFPTVIYCIGRCLGEMGKTKEASEKLMIVINRFPEAPETVRAKLWLEYYSR